MLYAKLPSSVQDLLRQQLTGTLTGLRIERESWLWHWKRLAEVYLPRRYRWFISGNQSNRGSPINGQIVDETGVIAARTCASGMLAGLTSPMSQWFKLNIHGFDQMDSGPVKIWLAECEKRMLRVFAGSNFYQSLGVAYHDVVVFGSASMIEYEDSDTAVRFYNPCLGEFLFGTSFRGDVDTHYREFVLTVSQLREQFGEENLSESTQALWRAGGASRTREIVVCHAIEPNTPLYDEAYEGPIYAVARKFPYREVYYEHGQQDSTVLKMTGFNEKPFFGIRWDVTSNESYGRGLGMDALPAVNQLQVEQRRKAEIIDKVGRPPMVGTPAMRNAPNSILPGAMNYVADISGAGFKPAFQVDSQAIPAITADIIDVQNRVKSIFFVDLFMMISNLDTVRTATEIDERKQEKLIQLGPVIERFENEVLDPIIDRTFAIMNRRGLLPPPPPEIAGQPITVQYVSMLAEAQRSGNTTGLERLSAFVGNIAGADQAVLDKLDFDEIVDEYADSLSVSPKAIRDSKAVAIIRQQRQQQQAQAAAAQASLAAVQGAQNLSKTDVGGGQNALQQIMGQ